MADEKKNDVNTELKDEELNDAAGGAGSWNPSESEMITCPFCGCIQWAGDLFCQSCGRDISLEKSRQGSEDFSQS